MEARMKNPVMVLDAMKPIQGLYKAAYQSGLDPELLELVHLRASQINGCAACVDAGGRNLRKAGTSDERMWSVAAWREAPYFTDAERAALALAEAMTRLADRPDAVSDELWDEAADHFDEKQLSGLILWISMTNFFNRLNTTVREPAGATWS
ncbi:carboxymuconolactone decarboxylase family protein [Actinomadura kijaniata]|uniref:AhpD family alkylhydroperoxidase n=1 Tax=Actinomadura namibiensis TaxID=182080 RepID=A0A7W3LWV3_ACTNM|nr:carboxymuconolactone decarboxylase family protein [Actinomadura namibiensis]MBA8955732.1 AhpD family alkylhydroperoxidase [Actinomadura namibiensis]